MNKKFLSLLLALILCFALVPAVLADSSKSVVYDQEQLFGEADTEMLNTRLAELCDTYNVDVAIVTTTSLDGKTAQEYADDFYDENGIGGGDSKGGILLMISSSERKWAISTAGYGIFAFTDDDLEYISDNFLPYLSDGDWYSACTSFISDCGPCLVAAEEDDQPYDPDDFDNDYDDNYEPITSSGYFSIAWLGMALIVGLIAAFIGMSVMKSGMKSVSMRESAADYLRAGSFKPGRQQDLFLYHTVTMTARPKNNDNDNGGHHGGFGSGGGFSSTHVSSSGTTHGGSSGSF